MTTLKTVGILSNAQLNGLLESLPKVAIIHRGEITVTVSAMKNGEKLKVLSAAKTGSKWHVMAVPGLVVIA